MEGQVPALKEGMCWGCSAVIKAEDKYCPRCGKGQGDHVPWYYSHWGIILATIFGLGPFGIILAWRSPRLNAQARWAYMITIAFFTGYVAIEVYRALVLVQSQLTSVLQTLQP